LGGRIVALEVPGTATRKQSEVRVIIPAEATLRMLLGVGRCSGRLIFFLLFDAWITDG
jgi:hypothetical protein